MLVALRASCSSPAAGFALRGRGQSGGNANSRCRCRNPFTPSPARRASVRSGRGSGWGLPAYLRGNVARPKPFQYAAKRRRGLSQPHRRQNPLTPPPPSPVGGGSRSAGIGATVPASRPSADDSVTAAKWPTLPPPQPFLALRASCSSPAAGFALRGRGQNGGNANSRCQCHNPFTPSPALRASVVPRGRVGVGVAMFITTR